MQRFFQGKFSVMVLSKHKACKMLEKLCSQDRFLFVFESEKQKIEEGKPNVLIVDQLQSEKLQQFIKNIPTTIVLKDTQKSDASILALSGQLSTFGQNHKQQFVSSHIVDFVVGIGLSILLRQIINHNDLKNSMIFNVSLVDLVRYLGAFNISAKENGFLKNPLGKNLLDGGVPFYRIYQCKKGLIAVGNLQPKFYQEMILGLQISQEKQKYLSKNQFNTEEWQKMEHLLSEIFLTKSSLQWQQIMSSYDTCVTQIVQNSPNVEIPQPRIYSLFRPKL